MNYNCAKNIVAHSLIEPLNLIGIEEEFSNVLDNIEHCSFPEKGQVSFKTFRYAKTLKKNPAQIAIDLSEQLSEIKAIYSAVAEGGFVNITVDNSVLAKGLIDEIETENKHVKPVINPDKKRILIEHSQPNTHKELHIGHTRNTVLGDVLCHMYHFFDYDVITENYHGDEGAHVAKCLWYIRKENIEPQEGENLGAWLGKAYSQANTFLKSVEDTDKEAEYKTEISEILQSIENKEGEPYQLWLKTREWSFDLFRKMYDWLGADFDHWTSESEVSEDSFKIVEKFYEKGLLIKSDGAIGMDLNDLNLGFFMLIKSDGRGLYSTKDIALAETRFQKYQADEYIYVVDNRQSYHFEQVFATLLKLGFSEAEKCYHLAYELVETVNGPMASRKGNIIPIFELIEKMENLCRENILTRKNNNITDLDNLARKISVAAIRYGMIKVDPDNKIIFDMDSWLKTEGNTGPYLQYAYTRTQSLLKKTVQVNYNDKTVNWALLEGQSERNLLYIMAKFKEIAYEALIKKKPSIFANYTYDLCKAFNSFYSDKQVNSEENEAVKKARISLTDLTAIYIKSALNLLKIPIVEEM